MKKILGFAGILGFGLIFSMVQIVQAGIIFSARENKEPVAIGVYKAIDLGSQVDNSVDECATCHVVKKDFHGHQFSCVECHKEKCVGQGGKDMMRSADSVNKLCSQCHEFGGFNHPINKKVTCVSCHAYHGNENKYMLLATDDSLCLQCHNL